MPRIPVWRGAATIQEDPCSPEQINDQNGFVWKRTYHGPFSALVANAPARRVSIAGTPGLTDSISINKEPGGNGKMVVTLVPNPQESVDWPDASGNIDIEWIEIQKKLEQHPRYATPGGDSYLSDNNLDDIEEWRNATTAEARQQIYNSKIVGTNAEEFVDKLRRGQDSYVVFAPVVRRSDRFTDQPDSEKCGVIQDPAIALFPNGYQYLKTADRVVRQNTYFEHLREWTGADEWDSDIYQEG